MTRREQQIGAIGQEHAVRALRLLGVERIRKIGTPVRMLPAKAAIPGQRVWRVFFGERVAADHTGILSPSGIFVLAESKTILDHNLTWSDFREHQPGELQDHADCGGVSLIVWIHESGIYVMRWPIPGFGPGKGITPEEAERLALPDDYFLKEWKR